MLDVTTATYFDELCRAMATLAQHPKSIFVGQGVGCAGTTMTDTLRDVPKSKLLEFPVAEDLQMGFCTGLSLEGWLPICIFPRWNFLLLAANQLVNHLDRLTSMSEYRPKVIIRTAVPVTYPKFDPGPQHDADFTDAFILMVRTLNVTRLAGTRDIEPGFREALRSPYSTLLVEYTANYGNVVPTGVGG
jgi:pyruvate/2-oxoglutarate/acetoin dehydrogenase E1 component